MFSSFPLFPEAASKVARQVDHLYFFLIAVTVFFSLLIGFLVIFFAIKYRRRSEVELPQPITGSTKLETLWTVIPFILVMAMFVWGASVYFTISRPPDDATQIYVVGKQWMWKLQHPGGQREINELHLPLNRAVKLTMASEDVIHSFYVPAFRVKADVVPGRYTSTWFKPDKVGTYHLFCAEYCGTKHSGMIGQVIVMEPTQYQTWLSGGSSEGPLSAKGEKLFQSLACNTCHRADGKGRGPVLAGIFGKPVPLQTGQKVMVDEAYIRESILNPTAKVVEGYQPVMPTFQGLISEEGLMQIIAYIQSLGPPAATLSAQPPDSQPAAPERQNPRK
jgi:cytochrome c oxidase subunit II